MRSLFSFLPILLLGALLTPFCVAQGVDGGVSETLQSIYIPPMLNAPFTAVVHTEWAKPLPGAGSYTLVNQRQVARDSQGRIYEERWLLVPKGGKLESVMNVIQIADPNAHTLYNCFLLRSPHSCTLQKFAERALTAYIPPVLATGHLAGDTGFTLHENLGTRSIQGIDTVGTRDTTTFNSGTFGNDRAFDVVREFWTDTELGVNLLSELDDPRIGRQTFTLTDLSLSEPNPELFELPAGYQVVDMRKR
jgi:hypothetical protein